jgi:flagellar basal-body rod protein FlgF
MRGIYIAASGLLAERARQDVIADNLANATTTHFKRGR